MVCRNKERAESAQKQIKESSKNEDIHIILADCSLKADMSKLANEFISKE